MPSLQRAGGRPGRQCVSNILLQLSKLNDRWYRGRIARYDAVNLQDCSRASYCRIARVWAMGKSVLRSRVLFEDVS